MRYIFALIHVGLRLNCAAGEKSTPDFISLTLRSLIRSQHNYRKNVWLSFNIKNSKICQQISISEFSLQCSSHYVVKGIPAFSTFSNESKAFDRNNCNYYIRQEWIQRRAIAPIAPPLKPAKVTLYTILSYNLGNNICDIKPFGGLLFCHSSEIYFISPTVAKPFRDLTTKDY